jgi:hypothetical protein
MVTTLKEDIFTEISIWASLALKASAIAIGRDTAHSSSKS